MTIATTAITAEALHTLWAEGINRSDPESLLALYEDDAAYVTAPHNTIRGLTAIREAITGLLSLSPTASIEPLLSVHGSGIALLISRWELTGTDQQGRPVAFHGQTSDVARQQPDGSWKFAIDNPFGDAAADGLQAG